VQISGTVTGQDDGLPIPGVSVSVKGTTLGTLTGADGKYSLTVPPRATTLTFSFIGMKTVDEAIGGRSVIDVVLEQDLLNLDEVIVTGVAAGTPKKKLAVSVERVDENRIKEVYAGSASSALQGKVAGITVINTTGEPGSAATILVRGATQITAGGQRCRAARGERVAGRHPRDGGFREHRHCSESPGPGFGPPARPARACRRGQPLRQ